MVKNAKQSVLKWCKEERIFREDNKDENAAFNLTINYPVNIPHLMNVVQPKNNDHVVILCKTDSDPELLKKMKSMVKKELDRFIWDIRFTLGSRPTEFEIRHKDGILESFMITAPIYLDGLTKDRFMSALRDVYKTKLLVIWKIQQKFGEA